MKKLTQRQIDEMAAKLDANGMSPGTPVWDMDTGELTSREKLLAKLEEAQRDAMAKR